MHFTVPQAREIRMLTQYTVVFSAFDFVTNQGTSRPACYHISSFEMMHIYYHIYCAQSVSFTPLNLKAP